MNTRIVSIILAASVAATLAACSSVPQRNAALDQARTSYSSAQANSQVTTLAADELKRAGDSLQIAEQAFIDKKPTATVDHLAYMTAQRVVLAEATASSRASQAVTAGAAADRDKMRLDQRTLEADKAQVELATADEAARRGAENLAASNERVSALESQLKDLNAKQTDRGLVVTLGDVLFDTGQARLLPGGVRNVEKLAEFFRAHPERTASIEGHTDSVGSAAANYTLSERRADAVMSALVRMGVPSASLSMRALGADMPTASNETATGRQMNRRVEIVFGKDTAVAAAN